MPRQILIGSIIEVRVKFFLDNQNTDSSIWYFEISYQLVHSELGEFSWQKGHISYYLGELYFAKRNYQKSLKYMIDYKASMRFAFGPNSLLYGFACKDIGDKYQVTHQYDSASINYSIAKSILSKELNKHDPRFHDLLRSLGLLSHRRRDYDQAHIYYSMILSLKKKKRVPDEKLYIKVLLDMSQLYLDINKKNKSYEYAKEAYYLSLSGYGTKHNLSAECLTMLGLINSRSNLLNDAIKYYRLALEIYESKYRHQKGYYECLELLGVTFSSAYMLDSSLFYYKKALRQSRLRYGVESNEFAQILRQIGSTKSKMGQMDSALYYCKKSLEIIRRHNKIDNVAYAKGLNSLANIYIVTGEDSHVLSILDSVIKITNEASIPNQRLSFNAYLNLSRVYINLGVHYKANNAHIKAGEILLDSHFYSRESGLSWRLVKISLDRAENFDKEVVLTESKEAYKTANELFGKSSVWTLPSIFQLSVAYADIGQKDSSLFFANVYYEIIQAKNFGLRSNHLAELGSIFMVNGSFEKGATLLEKAIEVGHNSSLGVEYQSSWVANLLYCRIKSNNQIDSANLNKLGNGMQFRIGERFNGLTSIGKMLYMKQEYYYSDLLHTTNEMNGYKPWLTLLNFNNVLLLKGSVAKHHLGLLDFLRRKDSSMVHLAYNDFSDKQQRIRGISWDSAVGYFNQVDSVEHQLSLLYARAHSEAQIAEYSWRDIKATLKPRELGIEIFRYVNYHNDSNRVRYVAYLVKQEWEQPIALTLFHEDSLESVYDMKMIQNEEDESRGGRTTSLLNEEHRESLYEMFWGRLEPFLFGIENISIAPDGLVHSIPFESLMKDSIPMQELYQIKRVTSMTSILNNSHVFELSSALVVGGVDYTCDLEKSLDSSFDTLVEQGPWAYLPGSHKESVKINQLLFDAGIQSTHLTGRSASENNVTSRANVSPTIIHLATHGFYFNKQNIKEISGNKFSTQSSSLERSGVVLSHANCKWDNSITLNDGVLTGNEVSELNLLETKLVVLSACETGVGDGRSPEGILGLPWAFFYAGVDKLIVSMWNVADEETSEFMVQFYINLLKDNSIEQAFWNAKSSLYHKYKSDPEIWGSFILICN